MQTLLFERIAQRPDNMLLSDKFGKKFRAPLTGKNLGHGSSVTKDRSDNSFMKNSILRRIAALFINDFAGLKPILHAHLCKVDTVVGLFDTGIGQVLVPQSKVKRAFGAETITHAQMISELKRRAETLRA